jgi:hypothetical protein
MLIAQKATPMIIHPAIALIASSSRYCRPRATFYARGRDAQSVRRVPADSLYTDKRKSSIPRERSREKLLITLRIRRGDGLFWDTPRYYLMTASNDAVSVVSALMGHSSGRSTGRDP